MLGLEHRSLSLGAVKQMLKGSFLRRQATVVAGVSEWVTQAASRSTGLE